jgi:hypothetical protein
MIVMPMPVYFTNTLILGQLASSADSWPDWFNVFGLLIHKHFSEGLSSLRYRAQGYIKFIFIVGVFLLELIELHGTQNVIKVFFNATVGR